MKLINSSIEIYEQSLGIENIYTQIEKVSRTCYKSEDKITSDSYKKFLKMLYDRGHWACFEHGTVYLKINNTSIFERFIIENYKNNKYSVVNFNYVSEFREAYITTNFRVLLENNWLGNLNYLCNPTEHHEKRITVKFICDRGISHEFVRHRVFSFAQESTRYCNYSKNKFNNELTFIIPCWINNIPNNSYYNYDDNIDEWQKSKNTNISNFLQSLAWEEKNYFTLLHNGWTPQQARAILPNALKTELVMTGTISQWMDFFKLRCDKSAHPDAQVLANAVKDEFIKRKYISNDIINNGFN